MLGLLAQADVTSYTTTTTTDNKGLGAVVLVLALFGLAAVVITIVAMWRVFEKAGEPGWKAIVPGYNSWTLAEIAGKPGWWGIVGLAGGVPLLGFIASIAAFVLYILIALELAKKFGKDTTFAVVGLIIFSFVGMCILAFGDAKYEGVTAKAVPPTPTPPAAATPPKA